MKKKLLGLTLITLLTAGKVSAQQDEQNTEASVVKSVSGLQIGPFGAWGYHEFKLDTEFALRAEAGLNGGIWFGSMYDDIGYVIAPVITAEPRWYYNLNKRVEKGRDIKGNSGNFISLKVSYMPDWFLINNDPEWKGMSLPEPDREIHDQISIVPTWAIRRTLGKHFDYEAGLGLGYVYRFQYKENGYTYKSDGGTILNLHLRIGYHF